MIDRMVIRVDVAVTLDSSTRETNRLQQTNAMD